ncbi:RHS repeat-associated protein [Herbinix hemicellulosilytica]|uniref:Teneurin-like YD-shell domain-containing protein n=1 Tax=Herbinix hemicellulosilytica TaxID=1564487 RepID=A0A0H5SIC6_HERHM|nr:RHS repeat-associated protein [Herbinix hemicellulosilytica]CRZ34850.1 hypothetical protein HHT355_1649 [Herbinix hemicellulosilytica]
MLLLTKIIKNLENTLFGKGWTFSFEAKCQLFDDGVIVDLPDGSSHIFRLENDRYIALSSHSQFTRNDDNTYVLTETDQSKYGFNEEGALIYIEDRYGNRTEVTYINGVITKLTDPVGRVYRIETNHKGHITKITNPNGDSVIYTYDDDGLLIFVANLVGGTTTYEYNSQGYLTKIIDPNGNVIQDIQYSSRKNYNDYVVTKCIDSYGGVWIYEYNSEKNQTKVIGQDGREWIYWYNEEMYITDIQNPDGSMSKTEYYETDENKLFADIKSTTDEYGNKTSYEVDSNGNITKITYSDGSEERFVYDQWNNCIIEVNEVGVHTYYCYDTDGIKLLKKIQRIDGKAIDGVTPENIYDVLSTIDYTDPNYIVVEYKYYSLLDAIQKFNCRLNGLLKSEINAEGEETVYTYDQYGNTATVTNAAGNTSHFTYDIMGNKTKEISPGGYEYRWRYDANGYVTREYYPDNGVVVSAYDLTGNLTQTVPQELYDPEKDFGNYYSGNEGTKYVYNSSGRLESVTDALGYKTDYLYDSYGNIVSEIRENSSIITYEYDNRDRIVKQWYNENKNSAKVLMKEIEYKTLPDGEHQITTYVYANDNDKIVQVTVNDNRGRKKEEYILEGDEKKALRQYTYNPDGTLAKETEADDSATYYFYDIQGNVTQKYIPTMKVNGKIYYTWIGYTYDRAGRLIKESIGSDFVENISPLSVPAITTYDIIYVYKDGLLIEQIEPSGLKTIYSYDSEGNIIRTQVGEGTVEDATAYITETTYDYRKNPLSISKFVRKGDLAGYDFGDKELAAITTSYQYDKEGRLVSETTPDGITTTYEYDAVGNLISVSKPVFNSEGIQTGIYTKKAEYNRDGHAVKITDSYGETTHYTYDNRGNLIKIVNPLGGVTLYQYDYTDRKIAEVSPKNYIEGKPISQMSRTEFRYDSTGKLAAQIDYVNENGTLKEVVTKTYFYDELGHVTRELDAYGNGAVYTYHPNGKIATEVSAIDAADETGQMTVFTYNVYNNLAKEERQGYTVNYTYDSMGNLVSVRDSLGDVISYSYDILGRKITETDGNGNVTTYTYNAFGNISSIKKPGDSSIDELTIFTQYDLNGRERIVYDTAGNRTEYKYDTLGNITAILEIDSANGEKLEKVYEYDLNSNLVRSIDEAGTITTVKYDALGRVKEESIHSDTLLTKVKTTVYEYDANGNCISKTDWLGNRTTYVYDERDRLIEEYDALNNLVSSNAYDYNGRLISKTDALNNTTYYSYDAAGNLSSVIDPMNAVTTYKYDSQNNLISTTDDMNNTTIYVYDGRNRMIGVYDAMSNYVSYEYDNANNLILQKDGNGNRIFYTFNVRNLEISRQDIGTEEKPILDAPKELYYYTPDGKISKKIDRNGRTTLYSYDGYGRLLSEIAGVDFKEYSYDAVGNLLTMTDISGTTSRTYDAEGRVLTKTVPTIGTVMYQYDIIMGAGEVKETAQTPDGVITETVYDAVGRIKKVGSYSIYNPYEYNDIVHYLYNSNGSRQATVYGDGTREDYFYDAAGRVTTIIHTDRYGNVLNLYSYTYDSVGNLTAETNNGQTTHYTYDANGRISSVTEPNGKITEYEYDQAGNRSVKREVFTGTEPITTYYTYDASNRLIIQENDLGDVIYYNYDANGNLISESGSITTVSGSALKWNVIDESENKPPETVSGSAIGFDVNKLVVGLTDENSTKDTVSGPAIKLVIPNKVNTIIDKTYQYDGFNRLIEYRQGDTRAYYTYNAEDYRVRKSVFSLDDVLDVLYFYEGDKVLLEADISGYITARNTYGTHLVSRTVNGNTYYYLYNSHGDVVMLIDTNTGLQAVTYRYDAFGTIINQTGYADNFITYAGYQYDKESGLYYVNSRYYNSDNGRFLTEDIYRGQLSDPLSLNRYTYCHNNPVRYTDPSGYGIFSTLLVSFAIGAVIGGVVEYTRQKITNKKGNVDWNAVAYEAVVGGVTGMIGGGLGASAAKTTAKTVAKTTAKSVAKNALKTGVTEAVMGFAADVGRQIIVDEKDIKEVDLGQAAKTAAVAGISGAVGYTIGEGIKRVGSNLKSKAGKHLDDAAKMIDDVIDKADESLENVAKKADLDSALKSRNNRPDLTAPANTTNGNSAGLTKPLNTTTDGNRLKMNLQYFAEGADEAAGSVTGRTADIGSVKGAKIYI